MLYMYEDNVLDDNIIEYLDLSKEKDDYKSSSFYIEIFFTICEFIRITHCI